MPFYQFTGDRRPGYDTRVLITPDINSVVRSVSRGVHIIELSTIQANALNTAYVITAVTEFSAEQLAPRADLPQSVLEKGAPFGYASLDSSGKVPLAQLPGGAGGGEAVTETDPVAMSYLATHEQNVTDAHNLTNRLSAKANAVHTHVVGDVTGLSTSLATLQPLSERGQANGYAELDTDGVVPASQLPANIGVLDASENDKGIIRLTGDLAGSAGAPTVPGLATKANIVHTHAQSDITNLASDLAAREQLANKGVANGYASLGADGKIPSAQLPSASAVPDATGSAKGLIQLAGDLAGTAAAPTVPGLVGKQSTSEKGVANGYASLGSDGKVPLSQLPSSSGNTPVDDATATVKGILRLAGDLGGTAVAPTVPGLSLKQSVSEKGQVNGYAGLGADGRVPASQLPANSAVGDATTTAKGILQLAGDLAGTAASPTVPGLSAKENISNKGVANGYASLGSDGKVPAAQLPSSSAVSDATTTAKGIVQLAGDLAGTAASPTVPGLALKQSTSQKGVANGYAGLGADGKVPTAQLPTSSTGVDTVNGIGSIVYANGVWPTRPTTGYPVYIWIGPNDPGAAMGANDIWIDTTA